MLIKDEVLRKRLYATTTDFFIVVMTNYFLVASFTNFLRTIFFHFPLHVQLFLIKKLSVMTSVSLMSLTFAYYSLFYYVTNGHTMGKSLFGLRVANSDGSEISLIQAMKRASAHLFCAFFGSFLFALSFLRNDQKSLADLFSKSTVELESAELESDKLQAQTPTEFSIIVNEQLSLLDNSEAEAKAPDSQSEDKEAA